MEDLIKIQAELKAPKGQFNNFGKYKYRSCEDILESVKPLLNKYNCTLTLSDEVVNVGNRYYIQATAILRNGKETVSVKALARESEAKKGMDESQITGTASSYARKYALNGLFCIDDTKDADSTNNHGKPQEVGIEKILENVYNIGTVDALTKLYNSLAPKLQADKKVITAIKERRDKLQNGN